MNSRVLGHLTKIPGAIVLSLVVFAHSVTCAQGPDRATCFVPHATPFAGRVAADRRFPNVGVQTDNDAAWQSYMRLWQMIASSPGQAQPRRFLRLAIDGETATTVRRGQSAPRWLAWRNGTYLQAETDHFQIFSRAGEAETLSIAADAEAFYWVWTQMFFPFWQGSRAVGEALQTLRGGSDLAAQLDAVTPLKYTPTRMHIVIFRDAAEYQNSLGRYEPGVAASTGFYSDGRATTFLYASDVPDRATRYHELTHQLFRQATFSRLGRQSPGERADFWLVEGIAGYMESLATPGPLATLGGWDCERLQYGRYRVLIGGDVLPFDELRTDGRLAAQRRPDLARWYAHAILQTHFLMDGNASGGRQWLYQQLAQLYQISNGWPKGTPPDPSPNELVAFLRVDDRLLQSNPPTRELEKLILAGCEITPEGLASIGECQRLRWLDLSRLPLGIEDVAKLCTAPERLETLSLEATRLVPEATVTWLTQCTSLKELDLSSTPVDDTLSRAIALMPKLQTLWLTGSRVGDATVDAAIPLRDLQNIDVQKTQATDAAVARLRTAHPKAQVNPLEVISP